MMITEKLLARYSESSFLDRLKARFLLHVYAAVFIALVFIIGYTTFLQSGNPVLDYLVDLRLLGITSGTLLLIIGCTILLLRGHFVLAAHSTIIAIFTAVWTVMIIDRSEIVARLDTIVLALAALSSASIFTSRKKTVILLYSGANLAVLYAFMFTFRGELNLSASVFTAYIADNTVAFLFVGYITYNVFNINTQALERAEESNRRLARAIGELEATNREYMEQNRDLLRSEEDRERIWLQLVQAQKLEAVGTMAGGIAHDFNNMLSAVTGNISMIRILLDRDGGSGNEGIRTCLDSAMEATRSAADMTRQMLTLSRKSEPGLVPLDVTGSMKRVERLCASSFPKSVSLEFDPGEKPLCILADPVQLEQVILNLCVNASHAMTIMRREGDRPGGILTVSAGETDFDGRTPTAHPGMEPGHYIRIRVSDTGVGMDDDVMRTIFDPFFTTKGSRDGTGLGLAITASIVNQHGGFIDVVSSPGKGSTFTVYMPAFAKEPALVQKIHDRSGVAPEARQITAGSDMSAALPTGKGVLARCG